MVDTWSSNYFKQFGTRVLYIAGKSYPNTLLPWRISPSPKEEARVLVGRVETLLVREEIEFAPIANRLVNDLYTSSLAGKVFFLSYRV